MTIPVMGCLLETLKILVYAGLGEPVEQLQGKACGMFAFKGVAEKVHCGGDVG